MGWGVFVEDLDFVFCSRLQSPTRSEFFVQLKVTQELFIAWGPSAINWIGLFGWSIL